MDLLKLISDIEKVDPEVYERLDPRRRVFKHFGLAGKTLTAAMLPGLVSGIFQRAYGQGVSITPAVRDVLNLALSLEYLEFYFYDTAIKATGLIPDVDLPAFRIIRNDESGHIKVLREVLGSAAVTATREDFDYSGGEGRGDGPFKGVHDPGKYALFLGVAQSFVDTGVRAYKGGAPVLMPNPDILESALNIHSVEARHSSHVRTVRRAVAPGGNPSNGTAVPGNLSDLNNVPKSWISGKDNDGPSPSTTPSTALVYGAGIAPENYPAENNTSQAGVPIVGAGITEVAASEAFDEPLDPATVKKIARYFVRNTTQLFV
ncbi:ferritin-like domain-containing protein [Hymenobacter sediminis]|uniref:ferritin-like domain-containing protein n=1 Tax=Hymenobacter sediminis TaxID=2218621 RepID=UPI000DA6AFB2|nr:ferritin-like domain-containing protein [Hymenobacter sediminis]RPD47826.1 ferritin-like domain-containing protein [Hymenobacter sediminis]